MSIEIASRNDVTIYDGSYVALAKLLDSALYTAEAALLDGLTPEDKEYVEHIAEYVSPQSTDPASAGI